MCIKTHTVHSMGRMALHVHTLNVMKAFLVGSTSLYTKKENTAATTTAITTTTTKRRVLAIVSSSLTHS